LHNTEAEKSKLNQKVAQLDALNKGIFVGDDMVAVNVLAQKRRDIDLDAKSLEIEERQQAGVIANLQGIIDSEGERLDRLSAAQVTTTKPGTVLAVGAAAGRHVNPGDTIASVIDCDKRFIVAIFSYRQGETMKPGTHVRIEGADVRSGVVTSVLPKTSEKVDERFAVPFPQTERRELYAIIAPDANNDADAIASQPSACTVGQWVTVTRENGIVPSVSVSWRRLERYIASWMKTDPASPSDAELRDASKRLKQALQSTSKTENGVAYPARELAQR
jgi:biotin carboxyl carrier protein